MAGIDAQRERYRDRKRKYSQYSKQPWHRQFASRCNQTADR
jgi:hypothetical protein